MNSQKVSKTDMSWRRAARKCVAALISLSALIACVPKPSYVTPSGKPEVDIVAPKPQVRDALVAQMVQRGYSMKTATDYSLVFEKPGGTLQNLLAGSTYDAQTMLRVTYTVVEANGGVKVIGSAGVVANPGSAFEKVTDVTGGKPGNQVYEMLEGAKYSLEKAPARP